jgi:hypothetical protein
VITVQLVGTAGFFFAVLVSVLCSTYGMVGADFVPANPGSGKSWIQNMFWQTETFPDELIKLILARMGRVRKWHFDDSDDDGYMHDDPVGSVIPGGDNGVLDVTEAPVATAPLNAIGAALLDETPARYVFHVCLVRISRFIISIPKSRNSQTSKVGSSCWSCQFRVLSFGFLNLEICVLSALKYFASNN